MSSPPAKVAISRHMQVGLIKTIFDDLIDRHAEAYMSAYPEVKEFSNFERSGTINYYIGMVWTNDYEKPDIEQLHIRGSQSLTKNKMLELDLSLVTEQRSFFPGQIIAFSAEPFLQRRLTVKQFLDPIKIAPPVKSLYNPEDTDLRIVLALGPFMKADQENWDLFDKLLDNVKEQKATHVILIGPFVDLENKQMRDHYDSSWAQVFDKIVEALFDYECYIYMVPSNRDVLHRSLGSSYIYPIPKVNFKVNLKEGASVKCYIVTVDDPAQIDLGGVYLDVTSADVLFHLNGCTSFINKGPESPFLSMFRHLLVQGIYPIYPAPQSDLAVDYAKLLKHIQLDRLGPHILVVPSRFNTSSLNNIEDRLVVTLQKCTIKKQALLLEFPKGLSTQISLQ